MTMYTLKYGVLFILVTSMGSKMALAVRIAIPIQGSRCDPICKRIVADSASIN